MEPYESKWADDTSRRYDIGNGPELVPLNDTDDYEVADNEPDVRGWDVLGKHGEKIGEVDDLIVDPKAMKVRYLDVETVDSLAADGKDRHILVPVGAAHLHEEDDKVVLEGLTKQQLEQCPPYSGCPITKDFAYKLRATYTNLNPGWANPSPGTDYNEHFYAHPLYDPNHLYERRKKK